MGRHSRTEEPRSLDEAMGRYLEVHPRPEVAGEAQEPLTDAEVREMGAAAASPWRTA